MTEKQYKLERWTDTSLYYSFPTGSVHQGIGYVIEKVENDLNQLAEENEQLKSEYNVLHTQYQDLKKFVENNFDEYLTQEKLNKQISKLSDENEQLKQQRIDLLRLIENNIEIYENINTNVEFHKGEIQGKLTLLNNLREVILNE